MDAATLQTSAYRILDEELDIEIGLRTRMLEVLQGRIAWAQTLQNTMRAGIPGEYPLVLPVFCALIHRSASKHTG
jgi:hypothetical protein